MVKWLFDFFIASFTIVVMKFCINVRFVNSLFRCEHREIQCLPELFHTKLLSDISSDNPTPWLCGTRRSAGLPFFFKVPCSSFPVRQVANPKLSAVLLYLVLQSKSSEGLKNLKTFPSKARKNSSFIWVQGLDLKISEISHLKLVERSAKTTKKAEM